MPESSIAEALSGYMYGSEWKDAAVKLAGSSATFRPSSHSLSVSVIRDGVGI